MFEATGLQGCLNVNIARGGVSSIGRTSYAVLLRESH